MVDGSERRHVAVATSLMGGCTPCRAKMKRQKVTNGWRTRARHGSGTSQPLPADVMPTRQYTPRTLFQTKNIEMPLVQEYVAEEDPLPAGDMPTGLRPEGRSLIRALMTMLVVLSILASGCEQGEGNGSALSGTQWRLTAWSASSPDPSSFTMTAGFDDSQMSGTSAVNFYSGTYAATTSGDFSVGTMQSTLMAGSDEAMRAERMYFELLGQARKFAVNETGLTLSDDGNHALLVFTRR